MTTTIDEILDWDALMRHVDAGEVSMRYHPEFEDLAIFNYTEKAAFDRIWTPETRMSRGLIVNLQTTEVLARPFPKFHNWDEPEAPSIAWDQKLYHWADKADGSLGILYRDPNGRPAIATRGSFTSEQAIHATKLLHSSGMAWVLDEVIDTGYTQLFEIIYPENRIVVNYGDRDELIKLGMIHIQTGAFVPNNPQQPRTFADLHHDLSRSNSEGWVAWASAYKVVKIKQADYVELHRIVTGLNRKSVWRALRDRTYADLLLQLPDELVAWAEDVKLEILSDLDYIDEQAVNAYIDAGGESGTQKEFALRVQKEITDTRIRGLVFSLRAGKGIRDAIYKMIEPVGGDR